MISALAEVKDMFVGTRLVLVLYVCWFAGLATLLRNLSPTIRWDPKKTIW